MANGDINNPEFADRPALPDFTTGLPPVTPIAPPPAGLKFKDVAPMICGVVDNGVCSDDPRVLVRLNEATKIIMDAMIPVGGMAISDVPAVGGFIVLPPEMENVIEAIPTKASTAVFGQKDIRQGWFDIGVGSSVYLDPAQHHDNPLVDIGLYADPASPNVLRRVFLYPGLSPDNATVRCTGARRFIPLTGDEDFLIVQNVEALKLIILYIERNENAAPDEAMKYRQQGFEILQGEVKKHILDPRNYMRRKADYQRDLTVFPEHSLGWVRANIALDLDAALRTGKIDLTWSINQAERRMMQHGIYKDTIVQIRANVAGGRVYFPLNVSSVLAASLDGQPIPIRSQFFEYLENGPGGCAAHAMMVDEGDRYFPAARNYRRSYKLLARCEEGQCISTVCKLRWLPKQPTDQMVIKNYEALRLMMTSKFLEEDEKWQEAMANQQQAFNILERETRDHLSGIKHTVHIQTYGFGLGDVGCYRGM